MAERGIRQSLLRLCHNPAVMSVGIQCELGSSTLASCPPEGALQVDVYMYGSMASRSWLVSALQDSMTNKDVVLNHIRNPADGAHGTPLWVVCGPFAGERITAVLTENDEAALATIGATRGMWCVRVLCDVVGAAHTHTIACTCIVLAQRGCSLHSSTIGAWIASRYCAVAWIGFWETPKKATPGVLTSHATMTDEGITHLCKATLSASA